MAPKGHKNSDWRRAEKRAEAARAKRASDKAARETEKQNKQAKTAAAIMQSFLVGGHSLNPSPACINLLKGHPKVRNLQHARIARACSSAAARLDAGCESAFRLNYTIGGLGAPRFHARLAAFLSDEYRSPCHADSLLTTNGVSHGIELVCRALTSPGDVVLMEQPSYFLARGILDSHHLRVLGAPCDDDGVDPVRLEARLTAGELPVPKLLYLVPQHSNPRGTSLPLPRRAALVSLAERFGFMLLCDDVYAMLSFDDAEPPPVDFRNQLSYVRGEDSDGVMVGFEAVLARRLTSPERRPRGARL